MVHPKEKPPINVVGDVAGHIAIVVVRHVVSVLFYFVCCVKFDWIGEIN